MSTDRGRRDLSGWMAAVGAVLVVLSLAWIWHTAPSEPGDPDKGAAVRVSDEREPARTAKRVDRKIRAEWVPGAPREVAIPKLGVAAPVLPVKAPGRTLVPPSDPQQLGWWADGARPGADAGSALITGHTVHDGGGALDDLEELGSGDEVRVRTDRGQIAYEVQSVRTFTKGTLADRAEQVFAQDGPGRLVLITCEDWDGEQYLSNVVVTATPAP